MEPPPLAPKTPEPPGTTAVGDIVAQGGFMAVANPSTSGLSGLFGFGVSGGAVFRPGVGVVGLLIGNFAPLEFGGGILQVWTFGPALRIGRTHHLNVGLIPTLTSIPNGRAGPLVSPFAALVLQAAAVFGRFTWLAQPILHFRGSGIIFTLTVGLGVAL